MQHQDGKKARETTDRTISQLASEAHGVVHRVELLRAGVTSEQIRNRLGKGSLIRVHRSTYLVGHRAPSRESTYLAAVKACGDQAVLFGRAAAHLWGLIKGTPPQPEVLAPVKRLVPGIRTRRCLTVAVCDVAAWRGIPVTTVPRTLVDLASSLPEPALARACHEAGVLYRTTPGHVAPVLGRLPNATGRAKLERVLRGEVRVTLSRLEARFLSRLKQAGLPLPVTNRMAGGRRVDCRWPEHRLTVELDSYRYHHSRHAWERDRRREREARARGDEFRRYTYGDVLDDPTFMVADLRLLLAG